MFLKDFVLQLHLACQNPGLMQHSDRECWLLALLCFPGVETQSGWKEHVQHGPEGVGSNPKQLGKETGMNKKWEEMKSPGRKLVRYQRLVGWEGEKEATTLQGMTANGRKRRTCGTSLWEECNSHGPAPILRLCSCFVLAAYVIHSNAKVCAWLCMTNCTVIPSLLSNFQLPFHFQTG